MYKRTGEDMTKVFLAPGGIALAFALGLSVCTNPYDPARERSAAD